MNRQYIIYTDGSCIKNPGPGGWAAIILYNNLKKTIVGSEIQTTNNRMELIAVIEAIKETQDASSIKLFTDSKYVKDGITLWINKWKTNEWKTSNKKIVKNSDLWKELDFRCKKLNIEWKWVKAHSGQPLNEEVDGLAREQAESI